MTASAVVTFRIDAELLAALRDKVRRDGRTVSAELVELVRSSVRPERRRPGKRRRTIGMFSEFDAPDLHEFIQLRRSVSRRMIASLAATKKRR